ncbi:hypothetical protein JHD50_07400 [Sulfurimonas sp. MAG313]|nr:hypothetical protein [Sulfurimonas sp. MAG313]MDF1881129.1 hypothetical protein [Sulfurimonas sp. MAG313]
MQVQQYIFQSPSTSAVQVGRPDPSTSEKSQVSPALTDIDRNPNLDSNSFKFTLSSVNVASSSSNVDVSSSLKTFSDINAQVQGTAAYAQEV